MSFFALCLAIAKLYLVKFLAENMNPRKHFRQFWRAFSHPNVFIFIIIGTGVIFLTFLTDNNALEIAISGFTSVFIGIGFNNFSSFETSMKDKEGLQAYVEYSRQLLEMTKLKNQKTSK